jgi:hypothetical protein
VTTKLNNSARAPPIYGVNIVALGGYVDKRPEVFKRLDMVHEIASLGVRGGGGG